jgi:hypothetical protein
MVGNNYWRSAGFFLKFANDDMCMMMVVLNYS